MSAPENTPLEQLVRPVGGNNAITACMLAVEFQTRWSDAQIAAMAALAPQFLSWGYVGRYVQRFQVHMGEASEQSRIDHQNSGHSFTAQPKDAATKLSFSEVAIRDQQLVLLCTKYNRWINLWADVEQVLKVVLPALAGAELSGATLEYVDVFKSIEGQTEFPVARILGESVYLPANASRNDGLWHSHNGFFSSAEASGFEHRLDNVNISRTGPHALQPEVENALTILTHHRYSKPQAGTVADAASLRRVFDIAHQANKVMLADIISPEAQAMISLWGTKA